jgi:hypothetical protein
VTAQVTPPRRKTPRKPSHRSRNASIAVIGVFVLLAVLGSATSRPTGNTGPTVPPDVAASDAAASDAGPDSSDEGTSAPPGESLLSFKGTGPLTSDPFQSSGDSVEVTYEYSCPTEDSFTINFYGTNSSPLLPDVIASDFGTTGTNTTTEALNRATGPFTVEVDSPCEWSVEVTGTP